MERLDLADYLLIAEAILGISADRLKRTAKLALVESALAAPFAGFGDHELYPESATKAAILCSRLVRNHPLTDGNATRLPGQVGRRLPAPAAIRYRMERHMRLPATAHTARPWRIHELTGDFGLEDVWALPTPGGPDDFPLLVEAIAAGDPSRMPSRAARALWSIRSTLGELLGWDDPDSGLGSRVPTLRDRLPEDLRATPRPDFDALPFTSLYVTDDELAAEVANRTVHGVMHIGWVPDGTGGYRGQMAVLVKPNGLLGTVYMAAIRPFRHRIVYPPLMRQFGKEWRAHTGDGPSPAAR
jgi:hypothetical protein